MPALCAALLAVSGCGSDDAEVAAAPPSVPTDLTPETIHGGLLMIENRDPSTLEAFASADESTLVGDTRVWEIRRGQRLVGTLQISAVLPKVDLLEEDIRSRFAGQVILGQFSRIRSGDVEVFTTTSNDKSVFLWFGEHLFQILQTKDRELDPEALLAEIIEYQDDQEGWVPLPDLLDFE